MAQCRIGLRASVQSHGARLAMEGEKCLPGWVPRVKVGFPIQELGGPDGLRGSAAGAVRCGIYRCHGTGGGCRLAPQSRPGAGAVCVGRANCCWFSLRSWRSWVGSADCRPTCALRERMTFWSARAVMAWNGCGGMVSPPADVVGLLGCGWGGRAGRALAERNSVGASAWCGSPAVGGGGKPYAPGPCMVGGPRGFKPGSAVYGAAVWG